MLLDVRFGDLGLQRNTSLHSIYKFFTELFHC